MTPMSCGVTVTFPDEMRDEHSCTTHEISEMLKNEGESRSCWCMPDVILRNNTRNGRGRGGGSGNSSQAARLSSTSGAPLSINELW